MAERRIINGYIVERQPDGRLVTIGPAGGTAPRMPADPTFPYQEPKARLDNQLTEAQIRKAALDASQASATQPYDVRKAAADATKAEAEAAALLARQARRGDNNPAAKLAGILKSIDDIAVDAKDNGGLGETGYWGSWLRDRPGTAAYDLQRKIDKIDANNAFSELQQMRENSPTGGALGGIAVEELKMLKSTVASLDPNMSQDEFLAQLQTARDHYAGLISRIDPTNKYAAPVDYRDDNQIAALAAGKAPTEVGGPQGPDRSNPLPTGPSFGGPQGDPSGFVPYGSTTRRINNPQWAGVNEAVKGMIIAGQSPDQIRAYLGQRGINTNVEGLNQAADYFRKTGKRDFRVNVDDIEVPMSGFEQFRNNAPQTAVGTGAATFLNAGGFGVPQALAGDQLQYLRDQNWKSALVGDVAGIIGATSGISKAGSSLSRSLMPSLLTGGGRTGNAIRAVAPDAAYGAIYGGVTEDDPLTGAATAAVGSGGVQLLGKGLQKTFTGATDPAVQYLTQRGIPLSLGETLGNNSIIGRQMQRMESIPVLGDLMSARRGEARDAVYRATLEDAVAPSGQQITGQGVDALASAQAIKNQAYTDAYGGINAPIDAQYVSEVAPFIRTGRNIYGDTGGEFGAVVKDDLAPLFGPNRALDGTSAQQFGQTVNDFASDFGSRGAYGNKAAMQLRGIGEATEGLVERTNPGAIPMIRNANQINANLTPIENAMITARGVPTPKQLEAAYTNNTKKFGGRAAAARGDKVPDVVRMAVNNAPNIGNSGTADRLAGIMPFLLPTALGGSAVGVETFTDSPFLTGSLATLAALSTRTGQKATQAALTKRPKALRRVGGLFGRRETQKGLAGMVTAPLLIED